MPQNLKVMGNTVFSAQFLMIMTTQQYPRILPLETAFGFGLEFKTIHISHIIDNSNLSVQSKLILNIFVDFIIHFISPSLRSCNSLQKLHHCLHPFSRNYKLFFNCLCDVYTSSLRDQKSNVFVFPMKSWEKRKCYKIILILNNQYWFYKSNIRYQFFA